MAIKMNKQIERLIVQLQGKNGMQRKKARNELVNIGKVALPFLINLLTDPKDQSRWEACKALGSIADTSTAIPLLGALNDESPEIRWLAAEALIAIKSAAVIPILDSLVKNFDSVNLHQGAHHVLKVLQKQNLLNQDTRAVIGKLDFPEPNSAVIFAVQKALSSIRKTG
jgi:HEAT repeat protein